MTTWRRWIALGMTAVFVVVVVRGASPPSGARVARSLPPPVAGTVAAAKPPPRPPEWAPPARARGTGWTDGPDDWVPVGPAASTSRAMGFVAPSGFTLHVPILTYHLVATPSEAGVALKGLVVPPALFDAQLERLQAAGWTTITLASLVDDLAAGRRPARHTFVITIDDGHVDGYVEALPILQRHGMVATYFVIAGRIGRKGYLDAAQVRALTIDGMEIGDHSMSHVNLIKKSESELTTEVAGAATVLARISGIYPVTFAYPFGDFSPRVADAVASAGLRMAVTTRTGTAETADIRYEIPRLRVGPGTLPSALLARLVALGW